MIRHALVIAAAGLLFGCATSEGYRQQMTQFIGATGDMLIIEWGEPVERQALSDGSQVWTYFREVRRYEAGGYRTVPRTREVTVEDEDGNVRKRTERYQDTVYDPPREWFETCETRFVLDPNRRVRDFRFIGEACVAYEMY